MKIYFKNLKGDLFRLGYMLWHRSDKWPGKKISEGKDQHDQAQWRRTQVATHATRAAHSGTIYTHQINRTF